MASKYHEIWKQLKESSNGRVAVAMHPSYHSNLIRMMAVEKNRDTAYKILLDSKSHKAIMTSKRTQSKIEFKLTLYYLNGIPVIEMKDL